MVSSCLGTYTGSNALGMHLSNLLIYVITLCVSDYVVPFEHLMYLPCADESIVKLLEHKPHIEINKLLRNVAPCVN